MDMQLFLIKIVAFDDIKRTMKKISLIILALLWIAIFSILIVALTDLIHNNPFREYRLLVGLAFIVISKFLGKIYRLLLSDKIRLVRCANRHSS